MPNTHQLCIRKYVFNELLAIFPTCVHLLCICSLLLLFCLGPCLVIYFLFFYLCYWERCTVFFLRAVIFPFHQGNPLSFHKALCLSKTYRKIFHSESFCLSFPVNWANSGCTSHSSLNLCHHLHCPTNSKYVVSLYYIEAPKKHYSIISLPKNLHKYLQTLQDG